MSDVQNTTPAAPAEPTIGEATTTPTVAPVQETPAASEPTVTDGPTTETVKAEETGDAPVESETAAAAPATEATEEKAVEPVSEGVLGYKGAGLLKQFTFSKKEFWLSDSPVTPQNLGSYLRGEKAEVSHPVVAWASQTGKGLLFFNKKGDTDRTQPAGVLPLYEATDLKKASPHEFSFELHGHKHSFKAANDAERDGWFHSLEKAMELGKVNKETTRSSEGYKSEMEKLNTPNVIGGAAVGSKARSQSRPKKSAEHDKEPTRTGSSEGEDEELKKKTKSRSTSRGMLNRLKAKKDETEAKREEKKEEKEEAKEEKKVEKEEAKAEKEAEKTNGEAVPLVAGAAALDAPSTAERATGAPVEEKKEEPVETLPAAPAVTATPTEEKPKEKVSKRGSIFGKIPGSWNSLKSPAKEKSEKDAELKPEVPPKDTAVSDVPPQLPETAATEPISGAAPVTDAAKPETEQAATETPAAADVVTPNKEKKNFLSGFRNSSFMSGRNRSVSPAAVTKEPATQTEAPAVPAKEETPVVAAAEPVKAEEPAATTEAAAAPVVPGENVADKPEEEKLAEPKAETTATSPSANKRSSVLGNFSSLGRRASKALNNMKAPKKENAAPTATEAKPTEESAVAADKPADTTTAPTTLEEEKENKPEPVISNSTPVAASA